MYKFLRENGTSPDAGAQLYALVEADKATGSVENPSDELAGKAIGAWTIFRLNTARKDVLKDIASVESAEDFETAVIAQYYKFTPTMFFNGAAAARMAVRAADRVLKDSFSAGAKNTSVVGDYADLALGATFAAAIGFPNVLNRNPENAAVVSNLIETANFSSGPFLAQLPAANKNANLFSLVPPEYYDRVLFSTVVLLFVTAGAAKYYAYRQEKKAQDRAYAIMQDRIKRGLSI
jgi:hypothetical protein